jgi:ABC-type polysaccharide/polyol phosphate export permease
MKTSLKNFWQLSVTLAKTSFKLRNEGSYLGILWYLLNPLLLFLLLLLVFSDRLGNNIPSYPLYLLLGIIIFNFFQRTTTESTKTIVRDYKGIIKSINFPRESLISSIVLKTFFSHLFEILLFIIFILIFKGSVVSLFFYPIILIFFCIFVFGACLILSSLTVYFADLENIWFFVSRLIWLGTPIFYAIEGQTRLFYVNLVNPLYYFITIAREIIIYSKVPELWMIFGGLGYSLLFLLIGLLIFNKLKIKFAEMI